MSSGQDPVYYSKPARPTRQPSQHKHPNQYELQNQQRPSLSRGNQESSYSGAPPSRSQNQQYTSHPEMSDSQASLIHPQDNIPAYARQEQPSLTPYAGSFRGGGHSASQHHSNESTHYGPSNPHTTESGILDSSHPTALADSQYQHPDQSSTSIYPGDQSTDQWPKQSPYSQPLYSQSGADMSYMSNPYGSVHQLPYAESQVHLTQSDEGAYYKNPHETVDMNGMQSQYPPSGFTRPGFPPYGQEGYSQSYLGSDGYAKHDPHTDFSGGWVGLAAPGTMLMQPYQPQAGYPGDYDPRAYNETRERILKKRTVKQIALTNGNLVLDVPVPGSICKPGQSEEFTSMRYSAATCDPDQWSQDRFTLRPYLGKRETELAICMTCYNEDEQLLFRTLGSVIRNIGYLSTRSRSKTWGANSWSKVVVFIVGDGRKKANDRMLKMLACYGLFSEGAMKDHVLEKEVTAHIFELTTQVIVDPMGGVEVAKCPVQLVFCLKEKNAKKINSHRWFFNAFCRQLNPNVTVLLDVGTMPTDHSIYHLWKTFDKNKKVGGACGEIAVDVGKMGWRLYNPLVASQNFEYKMSNILDKPLESVMGFIGVLPGAFSAYRWQALKGRPLEAYFKGEALHNGTLTGGSFINNLYLAEDRILCFELVVKQNEAWILKYVKAAKATTDVPDGVAELIAQRRRWLNGSLFASMFAVIHFWRIWTSGQNFLRKCVLQLQMVYNLVQLVFTWTSLANFFLAMYFLMKSATANSSKDPFGGQGTAVFEICQNTYIALVVVVTVCSLGSRPQGFNAMYMTVIMLFGALFVLLLYCVAWTIYLQLDAADLLQASGWTSSNIAHVLLYQSQVRAIVISILATFALYLVASLWMLDPWHMVTSFLQYLFLTPTYVTILAIYSLANLHDVSWGTKGSDAASSDLGGASLNKDKEGAATIVEVKVPASAKDAQELWQHAQSDLARKPVEQKQHRSAAIKQTDEQQNFRTKFLLFWLGTNAALIIIFTSTWWANYTTNDLKLSANPYLLFLFYATAALSAIRALGSLTYVILRLFGR